MRTVGYQSLYVAYADLKTLYNVHIWRTILDKHKCFHYNSQLYAIFVLPCVFPGEGYGVSYCRIPVSCTLCCLCWPADLVAAWHGEEAGPLQHTVPGLHTLANTGASPHLSTFAIKNYARVLFKGRGQINTQTAHIKLLAEPKPEPTFSNFYLLHVYPTCLINAILPSLRNFFKAVLV